MDYRDGTNLTGLAVGDEVAIAHSSSLRDRYEFVRVTHVTRTQLTVVDSIGTSLRFMVSTGRRVGDNGKSYDYTRLLRADYAHAIAAEHAVAKRRENALRRIENDLIHISHDLTAADAPANLRKLADNLEALQQEMGS